MMKSQPVKNEEEKLYWEKGFRVVKVATEADLFKQIGNTIYFDLVDYEEVTNFVIHKDSPFGVVMDSAERRFHVEVQCQQFWLFGKWQNHTSPLNRLLAPHEKEQTVEELSTKFQNADIKLFLEVPPRKDFVPMSVSGEEILLFFKLYEPEKKKCWYVGKMFVPDRYAPMDLERKLNEWVGGASHQQIQFYKEVNLVPTSMCERLDNLRRFQYIKLVNGSIIWFQKQPVQYHRLLRYPNISSFFEYIHNREDVQFRSRENPDKIILVLELSKKDTYVQVVYKVAKKLGVDDPSTIWLTAHHCKYPVDRPIEFRQGLELLEMLMPYEEKSEILYIEEKEMPLPGWECLKTLEVAFLTNLCDEVAIYPISLPKESTVADLMDEIKEKVQLPHPTANLRLLEVFRSKIYKIYSASERIEFITDQYCTLRAEEIPQEEKELGPGDLVIHVYHFKLEAGLIKNFGEPFLLVIKDCETLGMVKIRIQKKLQVQDVEFSKWKFAYVKVTGIEYLNQKDRYILSYWFQRPNISDSTDQYLGIDHSSSSDMVDPAGSSKKVDPPSSFQKADQPSSSGKADRPSSSKKKLLPPRLPPRPPRGGLLKFMRRS